MGVIQGRMYDYNNGRFLSVDPFIQAPTSTQSMNPYTYILNNPLSGTDPTGYSFTVTGSNIRYGSEKGGVGGKPADFRSESGKESINLDGSFKNGADRVGVKGAKTQGAKISGGNEGIGSQDKIDFTPSKENQVAQNDDDSSFLGFNFNNTNSDLPRPRIMDNATKFVVKQMVDATIDAGKNAAVITGAALIPYWGCIGGCSAGVFVLETAGILPPAKGVGALSKRLLNSTGGRATLEILSASEIKRIQNAANRTQQKITLIGSRAKLKGGNGETSDYDFILSGKSSQRHSASSSLPRGTQGGSQNSMGNEIGLDIFQDYNSKAPDYNVLDKNRPHIIFSPEKKL